MNNLYIINIIMHISFNQLYIYKCYTMKVETVCLCISSGKGENPTKKKFERKFQEIQDKPTSPLANIFFNKLMHEKI